MRNAVHCTDLPEDGPIEVQYFFQTLANLWLRILIWWLYMINLTDLIIIV